MKNADEPASPTFHESNCPYAGLTKREYFAGIALQGMLSWMRVTPEIHRLAVECADAILAELEKEQ